MIVMLSGRRTIGKDIGVTEDKHNKKHHLFVRMFCCNSKTYRFFSCLVSGSRSNAGVVLTPTNNFFSLKSLFLQPSQPSSLIVMKLDLLIPIHGHKFSIFFISIFHAGTTAFFLLFRNREHISTMFVCFFFLICYFVTISATLQYFIFVFLSLF